MTSPEPCTPTDPRGGVRAAHRLVLAVVAVLSAVVALTGPAAAQTDPADPDPPTSEAIDGSTTTTVAPDPTTTSEPPPSSTTTTTAAPSTTAAPTTAPEPSTTTTAPPATTTTTEARRSVAAAAVPIDPPEGFTEEQWRHVRRVVEACQSQPGEVCDRIYDWTGNRVLAQSVQWLFDVPLRIVLILAVAFVLNRFVRRAIDSNLQRIETRADAVGVTDPARVQRKGRRMATASSTLRSTATVVIFGIAGLIALSEMGIDLGPMLAGAGIAGIAIGFGAQNLVRDILAGLFVILEDQYGVGDTIDAGGIAIGTVEEFSLRVTKLRDVEGTLWFIPNGTIAQIGNKTQLWSRAILDVRVAYGDDHQRAGEIIKETADRVWQEQRPGERIIEEPELWGVERFDDAGVVIRLAVKSAPAEQWKVARTLRGEIKRALYDAGFEVPYPRTVWVPRDGHPERVTEPVSVPAGGPGAGSEGAEAGGSGPGGGGADR